jgi:uroporphyrinogen-III synthase
VDFVPSEFLGARLGQELGEVHGQRVLFPRAAGAREALALELTRRGAAVEDVIVYETLPASPDPLGLAELEQGVDAATFTSASTVDNFFRLLDGRAPQLLDGVVIACIGPVTADAARARGLTVQVQPAVHTVPGLVSALVERFA